ncbi:MAG: hypothetical protein IPP94_08250 [Ignavibacteria bacterium]|nr:hypothetical protein [Ignavibacteria bacterium]
MVEVPTLQRLTQHEQVIGSVDALECRAHRLCLARDDPAVTGANRRSASRSPATIARTIARSALAVQLADHEM